MRISGGALRGRLIPGPVPRGVRPTSARVREALFSMIGQELDGLTLLDPFAGAGLLAIEAASRGARLSLSDRDPEVIRHLRRALMSLSLEASLRRADARVALSAGSWDVVLLDPPYAEAPTPWLELGSRAALRTLVMEHASSAPVPSRVGEFLLDRTRRYGDTMLSLYEREEVGSPQNVPGS